jgi:hypothetical protein
MYEDKDIVLIKIKKAINKTTYHLKRKDKWR